MDWLSNNPVANMYGPHFLLLYGVVIVITLGACWWMLRNQAESLSQDETASNGVSFRESENAWWIKGIGALVILTLGGCLHH